MDSCGVVVAGGQGTRLGFAKQYLDLAGKPMWERAVKALVEGGISSVWLVVPRFDAARLSEYALNAPGLRVSKVVEGGTSRAESVARGLQSVFETYEELGNLLVAIHDAARPFVSPEDVSAVLAAAAATGGAMLGEPCVDTMKQVESGKVVRTIPREGLWKAQTPQVFRADWLQDAYRHSFGPEVTDDASLMESLGYPVQMVQSSGFNGKVTTKLDLEYADWLAKQRWGN